MTQYILKDALVAEIENLENTYKKCPTRNSYEEGLKDGRLIGYKDALHKINTLEVKEVDLEKEIDDFMAKEWDGIEEDKHFYDMIKNDLSDIAKHFFELGVSCQVNNINMEEVKAAAKAWSEDDENTRGCDYIGAVVAERAFVACAEWLINKAQKG